MPLEYAHFHTTAYENVHHNYLPDLSQRIVHLTLIVLYIAI